MARVSVFEVRCVKLKSSEREEEDRLVFVREGGGTTTIDESHAKRSEFFSYLSVLEKHVPCHRPSSAQNLHTLAPPTCLGGFFVATVFLLQTERKWH